MTIRYAIWAAVSTKEQAAEQKSSLPVQIAECRRVGAEKGWQETASPFVVPGESRTRWASLAQAEEAIPQLRAMLDAAQARKFDVLMVKDYDRFRELLDQVFRTLNDYSVQLYSLAQPIDPVPPEQFDPYASDSQELLIGFTMLRSRVEVRTTRRRYRTGMPDRAQKHGLPVVIPYGYKKPPGHESDRRAIPIPDDTLTPYIIACKDKFLAGASTPQIAEYLQQAGAPTPYELGKWFPATVRGMLRNPFYAGYIRWGATRVHLDRRTGKRNRDYHPTTAPVIAPGKHQPLWDDATRQAILDEFRRREYSSSGRRAATLSGLLKCGQCGSPMWVNYTVAGKGTRNPDYIIWHCGSRQTGHPSIHNPVALDQIILELRKALFGELPAQPTQPEPSDNIAKLFDLHQRRKRIADAYENGLYDLAEARERRKPIDDEIAALENQTRAVARTAAEAETRAEVLTYLRDHIDQLESILKGENSQNVNHVLKQVLQSVVIMNSETVSVKFK